MQDETDSETHGWLTGWLPSWRPTSMSLLKSTEARILARIQSELRTRFVTLQNQEKIWTLTVTNKHNTEPVPPSTPLVLLHGFGGGLGLWVQNLDALCGRRTIHALDLPGFGRSSRPRFPSDPELAEDLSVSAIEDWRRAMGLERFILLGHSLGGYLATSYAIRHPDRVSHLILVDPWGFPEKPQPGAQGSVTRPGPPRWVRVLASIVSLFNPLAVIRAAGPWGPGLVHRFRPDFKQKFEGVFDDDTMTEYIYHCNAQSPSGEVGFRALSQSLGWAKRPMLPRVPLLSPTLPVSLIYGAQSWVDSQTGDRVRELRPQSYTHIEVIEGASHHVYADQPHEFNQVVEKICNSVD
ncbi:(Lyso)-N-acylphosphatidylethanolamine lipase isoform X2 [Amia ocellicauda]|uniref:(Lyso)-N-acylphosphatidylethanolamine lipase isoform X2 n=1 Tax=Amia ocellicauda TaxID=2972642 RepID=UPI00346469C2